MIKKIILIIIFTLIYSTSWATDYYVRPASGEYGGEDGLSYATAYDGESDIVWADVDSGDGKLFICGTHYQTFDVNVSGEDGTPIQLVSCTIANGASADDPGIIDGGGSRQIAINISSRSYITIDGISTQNHSNGGGVCAIYAATSGSVTSNITISNVSVVEANQSGLFLSANDSLVENSTFDVGSGSPSGVTDAVFITWASSTDHGQRITVNGNIIIQRNNYVSYHHDAIQTRALTDFVLKNNFIQSVNGNVNSQTAMIEDHFGTLHIYNNIFVHNTNGNFDGMQLYTNGGATDWTASTYIWNNVFYNPKDDTYSAALTINNIEPPVLEIKNNIFISEERYAIRIGSSAVIPEKTDIVYNCLYSGYADIAHDGSDAFNWSEWVAEGYDATGSINADPSLDANYAPDAADDPVVNAGTDVGTIYGINPNSTWPDAITFLAQDDYGLWEIGAYVYVSAYFP